MFDMGHKDDFGVSLGSCFELNGRTEWEGSCVTEGCLMEGFVMDS